MDVIDVISKLDKFMLENQVSFSGIIIGGAALRLLQVTDRATRDIDFIDPKLDKKFLTITKEFRLANPKLNLDNEWVNNGPIGLIKDLPNDWQGRVVKLFEGNALSLKTLGKADLLKTKLYAYCDRDIDLQDCIDLAPTIDEIDSCKDWLVSRDSNKHWPERVIAQLSFLKGKLNE